MKKTMKILRRILGMLLALVLAAVGVVFLMWKDEILTLNSMEKLRERDDAHLDGRCIPCICPAASIWMTLSRRAA